MSLLLWLPLTENLYNQGVSSATITNVGATVSANGKLGSCYSFDGSNDGLVISNAPEIKNLSSVTISCWVYTTSSSSTQAIINHRTVVGSGLSLFLVGGKIRFDTGTETTFTYSYPTSSWFHLCVVSTGTKRYLYINGEKQEEITTSQINLSSSGSYASIGVSSANTSSFSGNYFVGKLNDFRLYSDALSAKQIKLISQGLVIHYPLNRGGFGCDNLIVGTGGSNYINVYASGATSNARLNITTTMNEGELFIKPTSATSAEKYFRFMTPKAGSLYGFTANTTYTFSAYIKGVSTSSGTVKYRSQWQISGGGWTGGNETVIISGDTPTDYYYFTQTETIPSGATAYYFSIQIYDSTDTTEVYLKNLKMENGANATNWCPNSLDSNYTSIGLNETVEFDTSGVNNNGTIYGSLNFSSDTPKYCVSSFFNGTNNAIYVGNFQSIIDNASAFTINIWFKKDSIGSKSYETLFGGPSGFELDTRSGSSASLSLYATSTRGGTIYSSFNFGEWYMVSMVSDRTNEYYYINGELVKTITAKTMPSGNYYVGAWQTESKQNYYGLLSDFRIYSTALSEAEILELYKTPVSIANNGALFTSGELMEG